VGGGLSYVNMRRRILVSSRGLNGKRGERIQTNRWGVSRRGRASGIGEDSGNATGSESPRLKRVASSRGS